MSAVLAPVSGTLTATSPVAKSPLAGVNVLLIGPTGTGKTYSLRKLADAGLQVFVLFTESGLETLVGSYTDGGQEVPPNVHWHMFKPTAYNFQNLISGAERVNTITLDAWAKITDPERGKFNQFVDFLKVLTDFPDDRTGKKFGSVDSWGTDKVLAIDSLSGLNYFAMALIIGSKPVKSLPEWGAAQEQLERVVRQLCDGCRCHFVLTAHIDREVDQVLGGMKIMVSTLGVKLAPKLTPMFSDVVLAYREGTKFLWSTANPSADLKTRNLPIQDGLAPDFTQIIAKWKSRGGVLEAA